MIYSVQIFELKFQKDQSYCTWCNG